MIQTQYYLSNLSSSYNILQDCGNCSRSVDKRRAGATGSLNKTGSSHWRLITSADD